MSPGESPRERLRVMGEPKRRSPPSRQTALTRSTAPPRTKTIERRTPLKRRRRRLSAAEEAERERFIACVREHGRCASCESEDPWHAHHAVYEQKLRRLGLRLWHPDNALRLCFACHATQHSPKGRLALAVLRDENIRYAFDVLGARAYQYLRKRYRGIDARLDREAARAGKAR